MTLQDIIAYLRPGPQQGVMNTNHLQELRLPHHSRILRPTQLQAKQRAGSTQDVELQLENQDPAGPQVSTPHTAAPAPNRSNKILTIEEYIAEYFPPVQEAKISPVPGKPVTMPVPLLQPVPVGSRSSKNTIELNEKYQLYAFARPVFEYAGSSDGGWDAKVCFLGQDLRTEGPFKTKQEAKEELSGQCLEVVRALVEKGELKKPEKGKKNGADGVLGAADIKKDKGDGENYIGQLLEYQRSKSHPPALYTDYQLGTLFSCVVTAANVPDQEFSSKDSLFPSKKLARQNAAKCLVQFYKDKGEWPEQFTSLGGIKKPKATSTSTPSSTSSPKSKSPSPPEPAFTLEQEIQNTLNASPRSPGHADGPAPTHAYQVARLSKYLGLGTPEWRYTPEPQENFHTVCCVFSRGGAHAGPHGEVRHMFGKKAAKEACAALVLAYLVELRERRAALGRAVLEGVVSGEMLGGETDEEFDSAVEEIGEQ